MVGRRGEKIERSVESLDRLFSVVVGLAITLAVQRTLFDSSQHLYTWYDGAKHTYPLLSAMGAPMPAMLAFVATIVPFYQGMGRHLNHTYVESQVSRAKEGFLVLDFFVFFLESCILLALASLISDGIAFFVCLALLLGFDAVWGLVAHGIHYGSGSPSTLRWTVINAVAVAALLLVSFGSVFPTMPGKLWALSVIALARTAWDYSWCWQLYFPEK